MLKPLFYSFEVRTCSPSEEQGLCWPHPREGPGRQGHRSVRRGPLGMCVCTALHSHTHSLSLIHTHTHTHTHRAQSLSHLYNLLCKNTRNLEVKVLFTALATAGWSAEPNKP